MTEKSNPGSFIKIWIFTYWNLAIGMHPGDVLKDEEGMQTMSNLGKNMAWLLKKLG
jgi:hypothetical protein